MGKDNEFREVEGAEDSQWGDVYHQRGMWARHWGLGGDRSEGRILGRAGQGLRGLARKPGVWGQGSNLRARTEVLSGVPDI